MPSPPKYRQPRLTVTYGYYLAGNVTSRTYLDGTVETLTYAYDGLGSVVNLTSSTGATWWTYSYLPYGGTRTATKNSNQAPDNLLRFAGGYLDPTALYHFGARQYDPGTGRFLSTDPVGPSIADPYVAAYLYANDNPVRYTDPSGRCPWCIGAIIGFVAYSGSVIVSNAIQGNSDLTAGWNLGDAVIATGAGALSGGLSSLGMTTSEQVIYNTIIGFDATAASMGMGNRHDPSELLLGTVLGGVGTFVPAGRGATGLFRGLVSSSALSTLQNLLLGGSQTGMVNGAVMK